MKCSDDKLLTPVYLRLSEEMPWPEDRVFYMLTGSGLFLCRNNEHFRSCVAARSWPGELAEQRKFLDLRYPRLPRQLVELAVGFFEAVGRAHDAEAALLLVWDKSKQVYRLVVPRQRCTVYQGWQGSTYPQGVHYDLPENMPRNWVIIGDIHSHVDLSAYSSATDKHDERYRSGLHIVVGRIYDEPPQFHVEATVDGVRFTVEQDEVFEGYQRRREDFPQKWFDWLKIEVNASTSYTGGSSSWKKSQEEDEEDGWQDTSGSASAGGYGVTVYSPKTDSWGSATRCAVVPAGSARNNGGNSNRKKKRDRDSRRRKQR